MTSYNYRRVVVHGHARADPQGHVCVHILIAEKALGKPLPVGAEVHHVDEDVSNNANQNLVICQDKAFHKLLHVRTRIVKAGGDPNTQRECDRCHELKFFSEFNRCHKNKSDGLQRYCRRCQSEYTKSYVRPPRNRAAA